MNSSKNDFLAKNEDDKDDMYYQTCTFIDHRVCNSSLYLSIRSYPIEWHLLACQSLDSLMNVIHSLSFMNIAYNSFHISFLTISCSHCNILYWKEKNIHEFTRENSKFSIYYLKNIIILSIANDIPESL